MFVTMKRELYRPRHLIGGLGFACIAVCLVLTVTLFSLTLEPLELTDAAPVAVFYEWLFPMTIVLMPVLWIAGGVLLLIYTTQWVATIIVDAVSASKKAAVQ